jgi:4-hydroxy-3-polyprenylbenzoate decarboxylase
VRNRRIVVALTGASGAIYGIRLLERLAAEPDVETHLIVSAAGMLTVRQETDYSGADVERLATVTYRSRDVGAAIASGSFVTDGMAVVPCSVKTLSAIANSYDADLVVRAADVTLKEGRPLILALRETPLHPGHIRLMQHAAEAGAVIAPPVPAFYNRPQSLDDLIDHFVDRVLTRLGFEGHGQEWNGVRNAGATELRPVGRAEP